MKNSCSINLVHMGDSITFGQYVDPAVRWTSLVELRLSKLLAESGVELKVFNCGVSGETTRQGLERFPAAVQERSPDLLTLQYGLNDCNCWATDRGLPRVSEGAFRANLAEMITRARHFGAREVILATNHPTVRQTVLPSGQRYEDANARYSEIIREVAKETKVVLCDVRSGFERFAEEQLRDLLLPHPDELHLSVRGNRIYADLIWPYIESAVKQLAP